MFIRHICVWLKIVCSCGRIHIDQDAALRLERNATIHSLVTLKLKSPCPCGAAPLVSACWDKNDQIITLGKQGDPFPASKALARFSLIPEDNAVVRRWTHPKRMVTTALHIPSIRLRPCIGGIRDDVRGESDLTYLLMKLIRVDQTLKRKLAGRTTREGTFQGDLMTHRKLLMAVQNAYTCYLDGNKLNSLDQIAGLTRVSSLDLRGNEVTDLAPLKGFTELKYLFINDNKVTDLAVLVEMAKADSEGQKRFSPFWKIYVYSIQ